jgi:hypothetical protein
VPDFNATFVGKMIKAKLGTTAQVNDLEWFVSGNEFKALMKADATGQRLQKCFLKDLHF